MATTNMSPGSRQRPLPMVVLLLLTASLLLVNTCKGQADSRPNIIYVLADGAGWDDFESHDPSMATPNIKRLRHEGIFLNQSYVLPMCAPTRAALLTGRYPHTMGMQDNSVGGQNLFWLNETLTLLPQAMKDLGYRTHMLGKWHMGFCHPGLLPLGRGFDTFYGFWMGAHNSYYNHSKGKSYDWWDQDKVDFTARGHYQTDILSDRAVQIVQNSTEPFFMYLAYGAPHGPFEVPEHYIETFCPDITNRSRQIHCGMVAALDVGLGRVVQALKDRGIYDHTVILFMSDNGGPVVSGSVNWPLRGGKKSLFEGGTRSYTILRAPGMTRTNITWSGKVHAIDWLPTLVEIGGGTRPSYTHGQSHWTQMLRNEASLRTSFIYNVDDFEKFSHMAIRMDQWKLIGAMPGLNPTTRWSVGLPGGWYPPYQLLDSGAEVWDHMKVKLYPNQYLLFNIEEDPNERNNLAEDPANADVIRRMKELLNTWVGQPNNNTNALYPLYPLPINPGKARNSLNGVFKTCWCDPPAFAGRNDCQEDEGNRRGGGGGGRGGGRRGGGRGGGRRGGRGGRGGTRGDRRRSGGRGGSRSRTNRRRGGAGGRRRGRA